MHKQIVVPTSQTKITFSTDARKKLFAGMNLAARAVGGTLGPRGRTVLIQHDGHAPIVTKDGVSVSKAINLRDPVERMGAELIREAASQTNDTAGDGTTTATVLTCAMAGEGMKLLEAGYPARKLTAGMQLAVERISSKLRENAVMVDTIEQVRQVGTISANGDKNIGSIIAEAMNKVGRDGIITVEDAKGTLTSFDVVEGMQFDRGYLSPYFVTNNEKMVALYNNAYVLVTDKALTGLKELVPILEQVIKTQGALLIIADNIEGEALQALVLNKMKTSLQVVAVRAPGFGEHRLELLNDLCALTGASLVSSSSGLSLDAIKLSDLGTCKKVIIDAKSTTIVGDGKRAEQVTAHIKSLRSQMQNVTLDTEDVSRLKIRIAKLSGGVAIIKVGGATEIEMIERKYRIEDALHATRAASEEGIVPGGGSALIYACRSTAFDDVNDLEIMAGVDVVKRACFAPLRQIVQNAGGSASVVINEIMKQESQNKMGYDAMAGVHVNMYESGVIDPCKVTRVALQNAASIATTFLTLDAVIFNEGGDERHDDD